MAVTFDSAQIKPSLSVTGIANIPNQVHHEVRATKHTINIALIGTHQNMLPIFPMYLQGDDGLGKTDFVNRCLEKTVFKELKDVNSEVDGMVEIRVRRADLVEAGFKARLSLIDIPRTGLHWDRLSS